MKFFLFAKKHYIVASLVLVLFLIITSFGMRVKSGKAMIPFGGQILNVTYCTCSANLAITVGAPNGGVFTYDGSGMVYSFYQLFRPGPWVLGSYTPGGACLSWYMCGTSPCCLPDFTTAPPIGTISEVGTSM